MITDRASGILLHPTSLPGEFGIGDFGTDAYHFVDWLESSGQRYWQMLPLGEAGPGNSPYMSSSAFAGSILLIDLQDLAGHGWLSQEDLTTDSRFVAEQVYFNIVKSFKIQRLRRAAEHFSVSNDAVMIEAFSVFCHAENSWLNDYALFMTIAKQEDWRDWNQWPSELVNRDDDALAKIASEQADELNFWKFCQWCFFRQWLKLKEYANQKSVRMIGDVPIFVAYQSADVWAHQGLFELDANGSATVVAGVPPDYFSETGQRWGNPLYRWEAHQATGYQWWLNRLRHALQSFDLVRIDHFRGFSGYWEIPASEPTAINGKWMPGPGAELFEVFEREFPDLPIIAEDLGVITDDVVELRDKFNLSGMRILQFAFAEQSEDNYFLPHHYIPNSVAYTGTHDNDTTLGWWDNASEGEKDFACRYLSSDGQEMHWDTIRAVSNSVANTVIFPLQDVMGLSGEYRMNFPGLLDGNWAWRFQWDKLYEEATIKLGEISCKANRCQ
jgi:4-alpha-glucanotransferase